MSISLRAYARHRKATGLAGGTLKSIQVAIASGRLSTSLTSDRAQIADAELADREWQATTQVDRIPLTGPSAAGQTPPDLQTSRARREAALAERAELELAQFKGELVGVAEARADVIDRYAIIRTKLLGVPSRVAQRMPHLAGEVVPVLDDLIREALEEIADSDPQEGP